MAKDRGIDCIVSLLEEAEQEHLALIEEAKICNTNSIEFVHFPIPDQGIPGITRFTGFIEQLYNQTKKSNGIYIHCRHGIGRSGMVVVAFLVRHGLPILDALELVAKKRGVRVPESLSQKKLLSAYAAALNIRE